MRRIIVATLLVLSCGGRETASLPPGPEDPVKNLAQLDAFANRVQAEGLKAAWINATEPGSNAKPKPFGVLPLLLLTDSEVGALHGRLRDPQQTRCLQAVHAKAVHMQSESNFRVAKATAAIARLRQQLPDLTAMPAVSDSLQRRQMWLSQARVANELAPLIRELIAARNSWAVARSQSGYLELLKQHRGYDPAMAERLEAQVRASLGSRSLSSSQPWDFEAMDPALAARMAERFDAAHCLERAAFVFKYLGLPRNPPALQVREAKQAAFSDFASYPIDPPRDQRITVRPGAGVTPHWSTFHEFGHAAMSLLAEPGSCRTFSRPVSPAVSESCAKIAERLFYSEEWLQSQHVPADEIVLLRNWEQQSELMRVRGILVDLEFERLLYRNPGGDLSAQYARMQRSTAGVQTGGDFPAWALKRHLAFEPLARGDYLLARCGQAAVYRRLRQMPGGLLGDPARRFVREQVFRGASGLRYDEWFRRATGAEPNCDAWIEDIATLKALRRIGA
ncbi:MAG TPA: hypothetical protein VE010_20940 [Thermoanaerobaculia bacterium]|nr:hypothetical protein [Thermoanaerobaculia bacterium]